MAGRSNASRKRVERNDNQRVREEVPATTSDGHYNFEDVSSSDEQETHRGSASSSSRRVHYTRHTPYQTEELENYFKKNAHPNEKEREDIGRKLKIELKKVKFWFQNKRTQMKAQTERHENSTLRQQNEQLKFELLALKEVVKNPLCVKCGAQATVSGRSIHDRKLLIENAQLREELSRMTTLFNQFFGKHSSVASLLPNNVTYASETSREDQAGGSCNYGSLEAQSQMGIGVPVQRNEYLEQASSAMEELLKIGLVNAPLWNRNVEGGGETLNFEEYAKAFPPCLGRKPLGFVSDATRASSVVPMTSSTLVEALLDADQWREMFTTMIGSCTTMEVISNGTDGSRNGALQLMKAEIQLLSPLVPVRVLNFIRFAKQQAEGIWIVVDLSVDYALEAHSTRRCPSGCILQDMPNGFSMVTWIEHAEYDEQPVSHEYRQLIRSGVGFGAQRWICALLRHCEGLGVTTSPTLLPNLYQNMKISLKGLARRMMSTFCAGVCLTGGQRWESVVVASGRPRIMARKCIHGLGEPYGIVTSATHSVWIPTNHQHLFSLLLRKDVRCMWDAICHNIATENMIHYPLSQDESSPNCISILNSNTSAEQNEIMVLQETSSDMTGSLIVYASVDSQTVSMVMSGEDTSLAVLLPSGLCIVPGYGERGLGAPGGERGSMVTIGYQILHPDVTTSDLTIEIINSINDLVSRTIIGIKEIVGSSRQRK